jgi:hypothetical protein
VAWGLGRVDKFKRVLKEVQDVCRTTEHLRDLTIEVVPDEACIPVLAWSSAENRGDSATMLVADLGGGTLDVALLDVLSFERGEFHVLALGGKSDVGGESIERGLVKAMKEESRRILSSICGSDPKGLPGDCTFEDGRVLRLLARSIIVDSTARFAPGEPLLKEFEIAEFCTLNFRGADGITRKICEHLGDGALKRFTESFKNLSRNSTDLGLDDLKKDWERVIEGVLRTRGERRVEFFLTGARASLGHLWTPSMRFVAVQGLFQMTC